METTDAQSPWVTNVSHNLSGRLSETIENIDEDARRKCCTWDPNHDWLPTTYFQRVHPVCTK